MILLEIPQMLMPFRDYKKATKSRAEFKQIQMIKRRKWKTCRNDARVLTTSAYNACCPLMFIALAAAPLS
jgi:hypothetical protein